MLVILDRDGVINYESEAYVKSPEEWLPIPGSLKAIAELKAAGHTVAVATNQSGVGRGYYTEDTLSAIHQKMTTLLKTEGGYIDYIAYCPHHPDAGCACRKPEPGMLQGILKALSFAPEDTVMIGDSWRDMQAAMAVGVRPILLRTGHGATTIATHDVPDHVKVFVDLSAAVQTLLKA